VDSPFHIVVADDDDDDQLIIKEAIKELNGQIRTTSVYDGKQLLDCLNKKGLFAETSGNPDLIILDINMPILNGLDALKALKKHEKFKSIPVFMMSTMRTIERVDTSMSLGAMDYYTKPNHISAFKSILTKILDQTIYSDKQLPN
jgi:CheY-like chemotaxis protein